MGASESVIVYQDDVKLAYNAGKIEVKDKCNLTLCSPKIENFDNKDDKNKMLLAFIIVLFILMLLFIKKKSN